MLNAEWQMGWTFPRSFRIPHSSFLPLSQPGSFVTGHAEQDRERVDGYFVLDKPAGISSAKALYAVKRALPRKAKVGHAGTLDPFATGVLVVLMGRATKTCERIMGLPKRYEATIRFGQTTDTLDPEGDVTAGPEPCDLTIKRLSAELARMVGPIDQIPPAFSAMKVQGRRAYDLARSGQAVELPARQVMLYEAEVVEVSGFEARIRICCGRGFYVRSLARDLAARMETLGYLTALRRTGVGPFTAERASGSFERSKVLGLDFLEEA